MLCLGGDWVKLSLNIGNRDGAINSMQNVTVIGTYQGLEKANWVHEAFKKLAVQIDSVEEIELQNKNYKLEK